jgi:hypothetical protein
LKSETDIYILDEGKLEGDDDIEDDGEEHVRGR